ncbi:hypothetical protein MHYP_G00319920 [Metynnis hypsauchen]
MQMEIRCLPSDLWAGEDAGPGGVDLFLAGLVSADEQQKTGLLITAASPLLVSIIPPDPEPLSFAYEWQSGPWERWALEWSQMPSQTVQSEAGDRAGLNRQLSSFDNRDCFPATDGGQISELCPQTRGLEWTLVLLEWTYF